MIHTNIETISKAVAALKRKYEESNPFELCECLGIGVRFEDMGDKETDCKGFFLVQSRIRRIVINSNLPQIIQKIICAHELGHAVLHKKQLSAYHELKLFDEASAAEYEANLFAAELLLDDDTVLEMLNGDMTFYQAAAALNVPFELLDFKFRAMKRKGYKLTEAPVIARSDFLKRDLGGYDYGD